MNHDFNFQITWESNNTDHLVTILAATFKNSICVSSTLNFIDGSPSKQNESNGAVYENNMSFYDAT